MNSLASELRTRASKEVIIRPLFLKPRSKLNIYLPVNVGHYLHGGDKLQREEMSVTPAQCAMDDLSLQLVNCLPVPRSAPFVADLSHIPCRLFIFTKASCALPTESVMIACSDR